jgi:uncharacterized peroxidase-related enzyme
MFRIKTVEEAHAQGATKNIYEGLRESLGIVPNVIKSLSIWPEALQAYAQLLGQVMFSESRLERKIKEMIAAHVSNLNQCGYCVGHHKNFMVQYGVPASTAEQIVKNPQSAEITPCQKKLLEYAGQITHGAYRVTDCQVKELRQSGWTDEQILEATVVASLFNDINRIADSLGVEPEVI